MIHPLLGQWYKLCPNCQNKLTLTGNLAECTNCHFTHYLNPAPTVTVVVEDREKILIVKRAIDPQKGMWDLPGGFINLDETIEAAVIRETKEETNLDVEIVKYLGSAPDIYGQTGLPTLNCLYQVRVVGGQAKPQDDVAAVEWRTIDDLPKKFAFENCKIAIERYKKLNNLL